MHSDFLILAIIDIVVVYQLYIFETAVNRGKVLNHENPEVGAILVIKKSLTKMIILEIIWAVILLLFTSYTLGLLYYPAVGAPILAYIILSFITFTAKKIILFFLFTSFFR